LGLKFCDVAFWQILLQKSAASGVWFGCGLWLRTLIIHRSRGAAFD
jgi:hypothetical protein